MTHPAPYPSPTLLVLGVVFVVVGGYGLLVGPWLLARSRAHGLSINVVLRKGETTSDGQARGLRQTDARIDWLRQRRRWFWIALIVGLALAVCSAVI